MKIEKINESQIHFVLSQEDLKNRQISLSDLSYGSIQSRKLMSELLSISKNRFDFSQDDSTLTIDAVPLSDGSLDITFTKEQFCDAIDTRYAVFSRSEVSVPSGFTEDGDSSLSSNAREVLDLYKSLRERKKVLSGKESVPEFSKISKIFRFRSLDDVISVAGRIQHIYKGESTLCRLSDYNYLYLMLKPGKQPPKDFNNICNIVSDFGTNIANDKGFKASFKEHGVVIIPRAAIETLTKI